jgi:hypothetical protein
MSLKEQVTQPFDPFYCQIHLTQGQVAFVSFCDYEWLNQWKWFAHWNPDTRSFYAARNIPKLESERRRQTMWMHRQILGLGLYRDDRRKGDHIHSGQTLDNRRQNLRIASDSQNNYNSRTRKDNPLGLKGVYRYRNGKFAAHIQVNKKQKFLGYYFTAKEAFDVYCKAAREFHGEFAHLG